MISHFTLNFLFSSQVKMTFIIFQKQAMLVRQLEEEVVKTRAHAKETNPEIKAHIEGLQMENDHLTREVAILKETTKVLKLINQMHQLLFQYYTDINILVIHFFFLFDILGTGNANRNTKTNASSKGRKYQKTFRNVAK